jgi:hypothetical protein
MKKIINLTLIVLVSITVIACTKGSEVIPKQKLPPVSPLSKQDTTYHNLIVR